MKLLLRAFDDPCEEATFAVVDVDIDKILNRRELWQMARSKDSSVAKLVFWSSVTFYAADLEEDVDLEVELFKHFDQEGWVALPLEPTEDEVERWGEPLRTDCDMECLYDTCVCWHALPKHGSGGPIHTQGVNYEDLLKLKEKKHA